MSGTEASEREKYRVIWELPGYRERSPGLRHLRDAVRWLRPPAGSSWTDWGCGTGAAAEGLANMGFQVRCVDIADNAYRGSLPFRVACLWDLPEDTEKTDYGFCADVMEHIPPAHVHGVLEGIARCTRRAVYFQIALFEDHFGDEIGQTLHLSVFPPAWWKHRILNVFRKAHFRVLRGRHLLVMARL